MVSKCCCQEVNFGCPFGALQDRGVREHIHEEHCIAKEYVLDLKDLTVFEDNELRDNEMGRRMYFCMNTFADKISGVGSIFIMGTKSVGHFSDSLCCNTGIPDHDCVYSPSESKCHEVYGVSAEYSHKSQVDETAFLRSPFSNSYNDKQWYAANTYSGVEGGFDTTKRPIFVPLSFQGITGIHPVLTNPSFGWSGFTGLGGPGRGSILQTHTKHTGYVKVTEKNCEMYDENDEWYKKIRLFVFMPGAGCTAECYEPCPFSVKLRCPSHSPCIDPGNLSIHCFSEGTFLGVISGGFGGGAGADEGIEIDGVRYNTADENYKYGNFGEEDVWEDCSLESCRYQLAGPNQEDGRCCSYNECYDKTNLPWQISDPAYFNKNTCENTLHGQWSSRGMCDVNPCLFTCLRGFDCGTDCIVPGGCVTCGPPMCDFELKGPPAENGRCCIEGECYDLNNPHWDVGYIVTAEQCDAAAGEFEHALWSFTGTCDVNPCKIQCPIQETCAGFCSNADCTGVCNLPTAFSDPSCPPSDIKEWVKTHHFRFTECEEEDSIRELVCCPPCTKDCNGPPCGWPPPDCGSFGLCGGKTPEEIAAERNTYPCCGAEINGGECSCPPCTDNCGVGTLCCEKGPGYGTCPDDCPEVGPWQCQTGKCPCPCPSCETDCNINGPYGCCMYGVGCPCPCDDCKSTDPNNPYMCCGHTIPNTGDICPCVCDNCINLLDETGCCGSINKTTGDPCPCPPHPCESDCNAIPSDRNGRLGVGCCGFAKCPCLCDTCVVAPRWEGDPVSFLCCGSTDINNNACPCQCEDCEFEQGMGSSINCCGWPGCSCECDSNCTVLGGNGGPWGCCGLQGGPPYHPCPCRCDNCEWVPGGAPSALCCGYINQYSGLPCPCYPPPLTDGSTL